MFPYKEEHHIDTVMTQNNKINSKEMPHIDMGDDEQYRPDFVNQQMGNLHGHYNVVEEVSKKRKENFSQMSKWKNSKRSPKRNEDNNERRHIPEVGNLKINRVLPIKNLRFPKNPSEIPNCRSVVIPTRFNSTKDYLSTMSEAVAEEMQLKLFDFAKRVFLSMSKIAMSFDERLFLSERKSTLHALTRDKIKSFEGEIICGRQSLTNENEWKTRDYIVIRHNNHPASTFHRDDVWIVSHDMKFSNPLVCRSLWHGPCRESGKVEVEILGNNRHSMADTNREVFIMLGPQLRNEFLTLGFLNDALNKEIGLLTKYLSGSEIQPTLPSSSSSTDNELLQLKHCVDGEPILLNDSQNRVIKHILKVVDRKRPEYLNEPICLVRGPFGAGKSHTLAALIVAISRYVESKHIEKLRIIVTGHTNNAVDRVLSSLLGMGFYDFIRTGSLRSIDKQILPYSLHVSRAEDGGKTDHIAELNDMLVKETCPNARSLLLEELEKAKSGKMRNRHEKLKHVSVVGTTCCSCVSDILENQIFDICLLDESSQIMEPLVRVFIGSLCLLVSNSIVIFLFAFLNWSFNLI